MLAADGEVVFRANCARCHGTYGPKGVYPGRTVALDEIGTDAVRLRSLSLEHRRSYGESWFAHNGDEKYIHDPGGYVAPPLDGIWASAPYFHNGSVPTLWHVLNPDARPVIWRRVEDGYDTDQVGLDVEIMGRLPRITSFKQLREFFDTRRLGKSAVGHLFPEELESDQKRAVLEYLKTL